MLFASSLHNMFTAAHLGTNAYCILLLQLLVYTHHSLIEALTLLCKITALYLNG